MSKLVTIYGGSGFLGRHIARRMAKAGWRVRVAVRRPNEALFVKPYGDVGQVEPVLCNIRDDASVLAAMQGADAVVNCVATTNPSGKNKFQNVNVEGAERVAKFAAECGIATMVHMSALSVGTASTSKYTKSKTDGEEAVLAHMPNAAILRPSVMFGADDIFFNRLATMARFGPILPIAAGNTVLQPVFVDDVAAAAEQAITTGATGVYEIGGPEALPFQDIVQKMLGVIGRRRLVINKPFFAANIMAFGFDMVQVMSGGLITNKILTRDQLKTLRVDNVVTEGAKTLADLGVQATPMLSVLPDYLWRFRPTGQFQEIRDSGKNLSL